MRVRPRRDAPVADEAPCGPVLTDYDLEHVTHYLRMLDAAAEHADWREVTEIVLRRDPARDKATAARCYQSHMARAQWMTEQGYRQMVWDANGKLI